MQRITTATELAGFGGKHRLRPDWHEPDEQDISARVAGVSFDNAGTWPADLIIEPDSPALELHVIFSRTEWPDDAIRPRVVEDLACVNLADLCAWAAQSGGLGGSYTEADAAGYTPRHATKV